MTSHSRETSSSFEALYDATQPESVSSSLPLAVSSFDSSPLLGDRFHNKFNKSAVTSRFEDLYMGTGCVDAELVSHSLATNRDRTPVYHEWSDNRWSVPDLGPM